MSSDVALEEIRFAVVLNGGVSLAAWMGGATHELNELTWRASRCDEKSYLIQTVGVDRRLVPQAPVVGALFGCASAAFAELAGSRYRYAAMALAREFSAVLGGGIAPLLSGVLVQLLTGWFGVVIYMMVIMAVAPVTAVRMPETRGRDLKLVADA